MFNDIGPTYWNGSEGNSNPLITPEMANALGGLDKNSPEGKGARTLLDMDPISFQGIQGILGGSSSTQEVASVPPKNGVSNEELSMPTKEIMAPQITQPDYGNPSTASPVYFDESEAFGGPTIPMSLETDTGAYVPPPNTSTENRFRSVSRDPNDEYNSFRSRVSRGEIATPFHEGVNVPPNYWGMPGVPSPYNGGTDYTGQRINTGFSNNRLAGIAELLGRIGSGLSLKGSAGQRLGDNMVEFAQSRREQGLKEASLQSLDNYRRTESMRYNQLNQPISKEIADELGLPYGTTYAQAHALGYKPASATQGKWAPKLYVTHDDKGRITGSMYISPTDIEGHENATQMGYKPMDVYRQTYGSSSVVGKNQTLTPEQRMVKGSIEAKLKRDYGLDREATWDEIMEGVAFFRQQTGQSQDQNIYLPSESGYVRVPKKGEGPGVPTGIKPPAKDKDTQTRQMEIATQIFKERERREPTKQEALDEWKKQFPQKGKKSLSDLLGKKGTPPASGKTKSGRDYWIWPDGKAYYQPPNSTKK